MKTTLLLTIVAIQLTMSCLTASAQSLTEFSLLGTWQCESLVHATAYNQAKSFFPPKWKPASDGLSASLASVLTFARSGGTYHVTSTAPNPIATVSEKEIDSLYRLNGNLLVFQYDDASVNSFYEVKAIDVSHMSLNPVGSTALPVINCERAASQAGDVLEKKAK
jgi:hypothetical protein